MSFWVKISVILWICSALQAVISFSAWEKSRDSTPRIFFLEHKMRPLNIDFLAISSHLFYLRSAGVSKHYYQSWIKITSNFKYAVIFRFPWNVRLKRMSTLLLIALEEKPSSLNYYLPPDFHIFRWPCFTNLKRHAFIAGELMIPMNGNLRKKYDTT